MEIPKKLEVLETYRNLKRIFNESETYSVNTQYNRNDIILSLYQRCIIVNRYVTLGLYQESVHTNCFINIGTIVRYHQSISMDISTGQVHYSEVASRTIALRIFIVQEMRHYKALVDRIKCCLIWKQPDERIWGFAISISGLSEGTRFGHMITVDQ